MLICESSKLDVFLIILTLFSCDEDAVGSSMLEKLKMQRTGVKYSWVTLDINISVIWFYCLACLSSIYCVMSLKVMT